MPGDPIFAVRMRFESCVFSPQAKSTMSAARVNTASDKSGQTEQNEHTHHHNGRNQPYIILEMEELH